MESVIESTQNTGEKTVDRQKVCPILVRVFCSSGRHHLPTDYMRGKTPANELQIYTWMDATLKELMNMVRASNPDARRRGTRFDFAVVYAEFRTPVYRMRDLGTTYAGRLGADDNVTLASKKFQIGDLIDVAITHPRPAGRGGMRSRPY
jgi:histone deacetylase complex subunit SAP18